MAKIAMLGAGSLAFLALDHGLLLGLAAVDHSLARAMFSGTAALGSEGSMRCAGATVWTIPDATTTARCSTRSFWPMCISR